MFAQGYKAPSCTAISADNLVRLFFSYSIVDFVVLYTFLIKKSSRVEDLMEYNIGMNKYNLNNNVGGFAPIIIIAIIAILAIGGGTYAVSKNKEKKEKLEANTEIKTNTEVNMEAETKGSLRSLLAIGKNTMCTFTSAHEGVTSSGTVYIATDGSMRGDFKSDTSVAGNINSSMIMKDGISYAWSGAQGMKMNAQVTPPTNTSTEQAVDLDAQVDYECSPWNRDDSKFNVPTNVNFIDLDAMMKAQSGTTMPSGVNLDAMMKLQTQ